MAAGTDVLNPPAPARRRGKATRRARDERRLAYMLCAPAVVVMLAVTAYPILYAVWLSLRRADLRFPAQSAFVGLANYVTVLRSGLWWQAVANTVIITIVSVAIELVFGMAIALVMHRALIGRTAVRTAVLIPYGIITVVAAFSWRFAWTPSVGYLPRWLHLNGDPLTAHASSLAIIILAEVWKTTPFMSLLLLAGLALVSNELLEAARVDGATAWQRFTNVILPVMKPAILVAVLF
ncbi:MAG: trehalose/maltose transport system permease protein, partial [Actinomycetota bacterium]|nr:trehalose/maltose transport system permease protein [Actinomycetota bacterium]